MITEVTYKGKTYKSKTGFEVISDEEYEQIKKDWYAKPDYKYVQYEMNDVKRGGTTIGKIVDYYFRDLMDNTQKYFDKWSINDVFDCKELLSIFVDKVRKNKKVFTSDSLCENIDTAFRLGGKGIASKVANFPIKIADEILYKYNANNNYYDFSCGWGARLTSAMKNNINYYGTDPNYLLTERLEKYAEDFKSSTRTNCETKIYCQGSEVFIPELEGKIGLAFSSPPYFYLEDYKIGDQSYKEGTSYQDWLDNYMLPTFKNIYRYLTDDGYFIINIKDFDGIPLEKDTQRCAEQAGFELHTIENLSQAQRVAGKVNSGDKTSVDVDENIYVFIKKGATPKLCYNKQISMFDL